MSHLLLGTELPIVQAPMAGSQGSRLALAVGAAGGLGSLPAASLSLEALQRELSVMSAAQRPYNVNFFAHRAPVSDATRDAAWRQLLASHYAEWGIDADKLPQAPGRNAFDEATAELIESFQPPVVSFHFGLPTAALLARVKRWGARVLSTATTVEEARWLEAHGADAVIAQGLEAGGHRGHFLSDDLTLQSGTMALLPRIVDAVRVPVIAAGGIATARGVQAALRLGASAVQVGTAYLLCPEADTAALHRAALLSPAAAHTALTNIFTGRPARGIVNHFMRACGPLNANVPEFPLATHWSAPLRAKAEAMGRDAYSPLWAGQHVVAGQVMSAGTLTRLLASGRPIQLLDELTTLR